MKIHLNNDNIPTYIEVYNSLYSDIVNGIYLPNEHLPGEVALSEKYSVSRNTLRQALAILNEDGLIIKSQGKGTIVAPAPDNNFDATIRNPMTSLSRDLITDTIITYNYGSPTDIAKTKLGLGESDIVLASNCIYKSNEDVIGYSFTQIPANFFPALGLKASDDHSIKETITETIFRYAVKSTLSIKLIYANEMEIEFLNIALNTPLILIEAILYNNPNMPFSRCKFYMLPARYHIDFVIG